MIDQFLKTAYSVAPGHKGSWFGLKDFGATEKIAGLVSGGKTTDLSNAISPKKPNAQVLGNNTNQPPPPGSQPPPFGGITNAGGAPGGGGAPAVASAPIDQIAQGPSQIDLINQAFTEEQNYLGGLEQTQQGQAAQARSLLQSEQPQVEQQLLNSKNQQLSELDATRTQRGLQNQTATAQVKQLLGDLQNRMASQLAATGGYGGSQAAVLAEAFGKQANQSLGTLQNNYQQSLDAINMETGKVKTFFENKMADVKMQYNRALNDIETQLSNQLAQIGQLRAQSAQAKANATMQAWQNYANMRNQLNINAQSFAMQLEAWKAQKEGALTEAQQYILGQVPDINAQAAMFNPAQGPTLQGSQQQFAPTAPVNSNTRARATTKPQDEQERQLASLGVLPSSIAFS